MSINAKWKEKHKKGLKCSRVMQTLTFITSQIFKTQMHHAFDLGDIRFHHITIRNDIFELAEMLVLVDPIRHLFFDSLLKIIMFQLKQTTGNKGLHQFILFIVKEQNSVINCKMTTI